MEPADFYSGIVVDAYAKLKSSTFNAEPYIEFVTASGEPALEVGCGDGEPLLDLCAEGLDVDGVPRHWTWSCAAARTRRSVE